MKETTPTADAERFEGRHVNPEGNPQERAGAQAQNPLIKNQVAAHSQRASGIVGRSHQSSLVRNLIGQKMERVFEVSGNQMVLMPANPAEGFRATYERQ